MMQTKPQDALQQKQDNFRLLVLVEMVIGLTVICLGWYSSNLGYPPVRATGPSAHVAMPDRPKPTIPVVNSKPGMALERKWENVGATDFTKALSLEILKLTNDERVKRGLDPLIWEDGLSLAALHHCKDMEDRQFFDHINPDDVGPALRVARLHRRFIGASGENIAWFQRSDFSMKEWAEQGVDGWMNSTGHRENILRPSFTHMGVGCWRVPQQDGTVKIYMAQVFGDLVGYLKEDLPIRNSAGKTLKPQVSSGKITLAGAEEVHLLNLQSNRTLTNPNKSMSLTLPAQKGAHQLIFHFPFKDKPGVYSVAHGPVIIIE